MLVGLPPYYSLDPNQNLKDILNGTLKIPKGMSEKTMNLILKFLNRNPLKRLGGGPRDAEEVKEHMYFADVNWDDVYNRKLPVPKPKIREEFYAVNIE